MNLYTIQSAIDAVRTAIATNNDIDGIITIIAGHNDITAIDEIIAINNDTIAINAINNAIIAINSDNVTTISSEIATYYASTILNCMNNTPNPPNNDIILAIEQSLEFMPELEREKESIKYMKEIVSYLEKNRERNIEKSIEKSIEKILEQICLIIKKAKSNTKELEKFKRIVTSIRDNMPTYVSSLFIDNHIRSALGDIENFLYTGRKL